MRLAASNFAWLHISMGRQVSVNSNMEGYPGLWLGAWQRRFTAAMRFTVHERMVLNDFEIFDHIFSIIVDHHTFPGKGIVFYW